MAVLLLVLLIAACVFFVGFALWVICSNFFTVDIPATIGQPLKLRILHSLFQLSVELGMVFEKLRICSMPQFARFLHDLRPLKKDPAVAVKNLRYGTIPVRLFQPKAPSRALRPGVVFFHGGAGILGSLNTHHVICCCLSKESDSVVLSVGYRMAPQHRFPAMVRDSLAATVHFLRSLDKYGVDPARVVVCGDSVGGGVAMAMSQILLDRTDLPKIRAQILIYPVLQCMDFQLPSYQQNKNAPMLTENFAFRCLFYYLGINPSWKSAIRRGAHLPAELWEKYGKWMGSENIPERFKKRGYCQEPRAPLNEGAYLETNLILDLMNSPLIAEDEVMSRLPEACIVSCEYDFLRDNSLLCKKRLEDLGVPVTWHHMEDGFHGVLTTLHMGCAHFPCATRILNVAVQFVKGL
ncbi:arylacetamide deacetylase-like 3 [Saccopteryx leptura]|uniref:arylacetamide deacetylase-like 3 n=1 Tax=Saccopteryx leptura TaxID=249018 RepID=UPI00339BCAF3